MSKQSKNNLDSVDQIRNILFGEQITIIEKRFALLEKNLTTTIKTLSNKVDSANADLKSKIETSNKLFSSENSSLALEQAATITSLETTINNKIIETESDLLNQIQSGLQKLDEKTSHRKELAKLLMDMANKLAD